METSDWIAIAALAVAALSWADSWRRIRRSEVRFAVETGDPRLDLYFVRNTGDRALRRVRIAPESLLGYEADGLLRAAELPPGASIDLYLKRSSAGHLPDTITVLYGRRGSAVVPFARAPDESTATPPATQ